jgi:hypothetical protein
MSVDVRHVPLERLTALALVGRAPVEETDQIALSHVQRCERCTTTLARLTSEADTLRAHAWAEADAAFDTALLEHQRSRILDRLAHLGQMARVLPFPSRSHDSGMPVNRSSRRWMTAAAAGLIIGLVSGQFLHFLPGDGVDDRDFVTIQAPPRAAAGIVPASATTRLLSDDELLDEIEAAVQLRRAQSLRALDALTPTAAEFRELSRAR